MQHVVVYSRPGYFAAWPANNGLWCWDGRTVLVGLVEGPFEEKPNHNIAEPYTDLLARSTDAGASWTTLAPHGFMRAGAPLADLPGPLDFTASGFALRVEGTGYHGSERPEGGFYVSVDRGDSWLGPYAFAGLRDEPRLQGLEITARTDYLVLGRREALVMLSARPPGGAMDGDRVFCARTADGGRSFGFLSWVVPREDPYRGVMPATVLTGPGRLVSAVRRRARREECWIDAYASEDEGARWSFASRVADTGGWNGNPPALAALRDGRLCCVFGDRATSRMLARYSRDGGRTWDEELVLRADFQPDSYDDPDLGYPRLVQRADGRLVAAYYWATPDQPHQFIAATIWDPESDRP
jgi:hypothetical protein